MLALVGLGNPGSQYQETRHNAGFLFIDSLAKELSISLSEKKFDAFFGRGKLNDQDIVLLKPQTYMNRSGLSVQKALAFFKIPENQLIVIFDDLDLSFGQIKTRFGGGHSGHNGVRSLLECLPSDKFYRVKIGIGRPIYKQDTANWVLQQFQPDELATLQNEVFPIAKTRILNFLHEITIKTKKEQ